MWLAPCSPAHRGLRTVDTEVKLAGLVGIGLRLSHQGRAEVLVGWNVEVLRLRAVAGRRPVLAAPEPGAEGHRGSRARLPLDVVARASGHRIDLGEDFLGDERPRVHELDAVGAPLQPPEVAVAARVHQALHRAPVLRKVDQQRRRDLVPVPGVVPVVLVMITDLARVDVERDHRRRVEVVSGLACRPSTAPHCRSPSSSGRAGDRSAR